MNKTILFFFLAFVCAFSVYSAPSRDSASSSQGNNFSPEAKYAELLDWINKGKNDVVSAGGIKTDERGDIEVYEFYNISGKYRFAIKNDRVVALSFENDNRQNTTSGRILYKNESDFRNDSENVIVLAQSIGAYLHHEITENDINHIHYRVDPDGNFGADFNIFTYVADKSENNYGYYSIMITPDVAFALALMPPLPDDFLPPPPGGHDL
jgi:hypothetical protein